MGTALLSGVLFEISRRRDEALPHPKSREKHYRDDDKPNSANVLWNFFKWTIDMAEYRNAKDNVNLAKNRTFGSSFHD
jgi:hypothetical protein